MGLPKDKEFKDGEVVDKVEEEPAKPAKKK